MTDTSNRKAELLSSPIEHIDITQFDGRELIDSWEKMSFTSRDAARPPASCRPPSPIRTVR